MLGKVVRGSISDGIDIKLFPGNVIEDVRVGQFLTIEGKKKLYLSLITDIKYESNNPKLLTDAVDVYEEIDEVILDGTGIYGIVNVSPSIEIDKEYGIPLTVKSIPSYGSMTRYASSEDIKKVFGEPNDINFVIGTPPDMDIPVCINLKKLVERSTGIFGRAGTGKTFLTRLLLAGIIKSNQAVNLIFDAHNEYGHGGKDEERGKVKGLVHLFGKSKVKVFTMDPRSSANRKASYDGEIVISFDQIEDEDIMLLGSELNLNNTAHECIYLLQKKFGHKNWLSEFLKIQESEIDEDFAKGIGAHRGALQALRRKLQRIERLPFMRETAPDVISQIMNCLKQDIHVVIEFGQVETLGYMLVTNIITRKIHERYVEEVERALGSDQKLPKPLVITLEEAHRFLDPSISKDTIMGKIAREMRKYNVVLLIVDQRTSQIDKEIMSQIGTKITCRLEDDSDISSFLSGVNNASRLRNILASLDQKEQALLIGYAVPMPVVINTRKYDERFYKEVSTFADDDEILNKPFEEELKEKGYDQLFPEF